MSDHYDELHAEIECLREENRKLMQAQEPVAIPEGCLWAVTKGGRTICQPPRRDPLYAAPLSGTVNVPREPTYEQEAAGGVVLWEKQFEGTPWKNKVKLIDPASMGEYNEVARHVYDAMLAAAPAASNTRTAPAQEPVLKSIQSLDGKLLARFYDYGYFNKVMAAIDAAIAASQGEKP